MHSLATTPSAFTGLWSELAPIGLDRHGAGYVRHGWTSTDAELRSWFTQQAAARGLDVEVDGNGNQWAWWGLPGPGAVVTGSHLDSVPAGGAFDGPLGVVSAFLAVDELRRRGVVPNRPLAVTNFVEEEGSRFGIACLGSRLATGALDAQRALALRDPDGITLGEALTRTGHDVRRVGADPQRLRDVGVFVELHVEQGRALVDQGRPLGVASAIWPHGRYRFDFRGAANHAGTTAMADRVDPMITYAATVLAAHQRAQAAGRRATFGRVQVVPNGTNAIPSAVSAWLDARCASDDVLADLVAEIEAAAQDAAGTTGVGVAVTAESATPEIVFPAGLAARLARTVGGGDGPAPLLPTQAGHDAGILAVGGVPSAMVFVRNPTGVSHSPEEHAEVDDCLAGVAGLADVLADLLADPST